MGFSQTIFKKGHIVNLQNDTIEGYVVLHKSKDFYSKVSFTTDKRKERTVYTPETIKAYSYSSKSKFEAFDIPTIDQSFIVENEPKKRKFLSVFSTSDEITFYTFYDDGERQFFIKNQADKLIPLIFNKKNVEDYKVSKKRYKLPNGEILNVNEGALITGIDGKVYTYEKGQLFQVNPVYLQELNKLAFSLNCNIEEKIKRTKLTQFSLSSYTNELEECTGKTFKSLNKNFSPQLSLLLLGSTHPHSRKLHIGYEQGLLLEIRENSVSPNYSIGLGYFQYDITNNIKDFVYEGGAIEKTIAKVESNAALLKINYHFRNGKDFRPYVSLNSRILTYQIDYSFINTGEFLYRENDIDYTLGGSAGVDYYLFRYLQIRAEVEFTGILSYQVGVGISIF
jgi:hypothetical protein